MARTPVRRLIERGIEAGADYIPDALEVPLRKVFNMNTPSMAVTPKAKPKLAVTPKAKPKLAVTPKPKQLALPAPPKVLALPAPAEGLPSFAVKPRGGQFYPDVSLRPIDAQAAGYKLDNYTDQYGVDRYQVVTPEGHRPPSYAGSTPEIGNSMLKGYFQRVTPENNKSPEAAARIARRDYGLDQRGEEPTLQGNLGNWLERTLAKYYKTDFGSPNDPLRELAERGMHYDPAMTPEMWQQSVNDRLVKTPMGFVTTPRSVKDIRAEMNDDIVEAGYMGAVDPVAAGMLMQAAPWLRKQPVTDNLYGIQNNLDLDHFVDEMENALQPERSGLPLDLAVRPESLDRMTFAQAAEQVGKINQFRAKEMERVALGNLDSPAVWTHKTYAENNPKGLRWTELKAPEHSDNLLDDVDRGLVDLAVKEGRTVDPAHMDEVRASRSRKALEDALKYEGDTMGHCVGGYCPDVMSGKSRIFSLRDAKGEPHVTIETKPANMRGPMGGPNRSQRDAMFEQAKQEIEALNLNNLDTENLRIKQRERELVDAFRAERAANPPPETIVQIKGKQNRAPKEDYIPFVQDFVKSGKWGEVDDLANADLVMLPDGRFITPAQVEEALSSANWNDDIRQHVRDRIVGNDFNNSPEIWDDLSQYFEGYAIGGRVSADRCFSKGKSAVYAVNKSRK